jgi:hypothetical protein
LIGVAVGVGDGVAASVAFATVAALAWGTVPGADFEGKDASVHESGSYAASTAGPKVRMARIVGGTRPFEWLIGVSNG